MEVEALWNTFWRLRRRVHNTNGRQPITWADLTNFRLNACITLDPWQVEIIEMLDNAYLDAKPEEEDQPDEE